MGCEASRVKGENEKSLGGRHLSAAEKDLAVKYAKRNADLYQRWHTLLFRYRACDSPLDTPQLPWVRHSPHSGARMNTVVLLCASPSDQRLASCWHGEVRLATLTVRIRDAAHGNIESGSNSTTDSERTSSFCDRAMDAPYSKEDSFSYKRTEYYLVAVKNWALPLKGGCSQWSEERKQKVNHAIETWRHLSAGCEGLVFCIGWQGGGASEGEKKNDRMKEKGHCAPPSLLVYMELCRYGSLQQFVDRTMTSTFGKRRLHELTARALLHEVLRTLLYLHRKDVQQRDLTPHKILIQYPLEVVYGTLFPTALGETSEQWHENFWTSSTQWCLEDLPCIKEEIRKHFTTKPNRRIKCSFSEHMRSIFEFEPSPLGPSSSLLECTEVLQWLNECPVTPPGRVYHSGMTDSDQSFDNVDSSEAEPRLNSPQKTSTRKADDLTMKMEELNNRPDLSNHYRFPLKAEEMHQQPNTLCLRVPQKFSCITMGYDYAKLYNVSRGMKSDMCLLAQWNRKAIESVWPPTIASTPLHRDDPNRNLTPKRPSPTMVLGCPPPMLIDHVMWPAECQGRRWLIRPRFATRLLPTAQLRRLMLEPENLFRDTEAPHASASHPFAASRSHSGSSFLAAWKWSHSDFLAPESIMNGSFSEESDVYSWALTFLQVTRENATESATPLSFCLPFTACTSSSEKDDACRIRHNQLCRYYKNKMQKEKEDCLKFKALYEEMQPESHAAGPSAPPHDLVDQAMPTSWPRITVWRRRQPHNMVLFPIAVPLSPHLSLSCRLMLTWCLQLDRTRRPSASELLACPYFKETSWISQDPLKGWRTESVDSNTSKDCPIPLTHCPLAADEPFATFPEAPWKVRD